MKITGPAIGSYLYEVGGFVIPFEIVGGIGLIVACSMVFIIPNVKQDPKESKIVIGKKLTFSNIIRCPSIYLPYIDNTICFMGNGMITAMMEPHLKAVGATQSEVGVSFLIFGACFAISSPLAGLVKLQP